MSVRPPPNITPDYSRVLAALFEFMIIGGMQRKDILALAGQALSKAERIGYAARKNASGRLATAALVLDAWHRDRRYLNAKAEPRPVRLVGPAPSVEALIRAEHGRQDTANLVHLLKSLRLVVSCGKNLYKPTGNIALLSAFDSFAIQHVARSLSMLLETIGHNLAQPRDSPRLIERFAEVPDLPSEHIAAFQEFAQIQGWMLLRTINDWLESRRARRNSRRAKGAVRAGMHVYAYVAPASRRASPRGSARSKR